ncbi:related to uridine ribohydrolase [Rhynchosporium secalis]|uniref:Related to uridine ribohydrolase n=1 Tax=Rhynchosporium secalis TaxID=38038 RepID=A0A1E1MDQ3_RHYSE|nr:related to uridine ribohydrolase [Rhynchosporium secalis]
MGSNGKVPVWLDCDPGHDDAFAILLAAYHPSMELLGISTVHGNASLANTTWNTSSILTAIGKPDIPVYSGAAKGLIRPAVHADAIHGESGLDGTRLLPTPLTPFKTEPCIPAIAAALFKTPPVTAWVVATGALTNIALLFQAHPELASHIKGLSIMGGALGSSFTTAPMGIVNDTSRIGNYTPYAEFNILVDPEAASFLLSHPILSLKTTLIPLDVTHLVLATKDVQEMLHYGKTNLNSEETGSGKGSGKRKCSVLRTMLLELLLFIAKTYAEVFGITAGPPLHDPLAVAALLDSIPGFNPLFQDYLQPGHRERYAVKVITEGTHAEALAGEAQTGRTVATLLDEGEDGIRIPRGLDVRRFWDMIEDCLVRADEVNAKK